jgi:hypothetical protein
LNESDKEEHPECHRRKDGRDLVLRDGLAHDFPGAAICMTEFAGAAFCPEFLLPSFFASKTWSSGMRRIHGQFHHLFGFRS